MLGPDHTLQEYLEEACLGGYIYDEELGDPDHGIAAGTVWEDVPDDIKETFERIGIPEAERKYLAGVGAKLFEVSELQENQARILAILQARS